MIRGRGGAETRIWKVEEQGQADASASNGNGAGSRADSDSAEEQPSGLIVGRLSSRELQGGETIGGQIQDGFRLAERNGLGVAYVIASTNFNFEIPFDERHDFQLCVETFDRDECSWVAFREPERVARRVLIAERFYEQLQERGAELWFANRDAPVDWDSETDVCMLSIQNAFGQNERAKLRKRTGEALRRRWVEEGRGWPGARQYGFSRNRRTRFPEIDDEQWPSIAYIHENFATAAKRASGRRTGVSALVEMLEKDLGIKLSNTRIRTILQDSIYVDGKYTVNIDGQPVWCEPIKLGGRAIPRALFQANQELLAIQKGPNSKTPVGTYAFNNIPIRHAACIDEPHPKGKGIRCVLRARHFPGCEAPRYYHSPWTPQHCDGYTIGRDELDPLIIRALWRLVDDPELQKAWASAARPPSTDTVQTYTPTQINDLERQLMNLEAERERLVSDYTGSIREGAKANVETFGRLTEALDEDIKRLGSQLTIARSQARRQRTPVEVDHGPSQEELRAALKEILTEDVPEDLALRRRRAAALAGCLSEVILHDAGNGIEIELVGHLWPEGDVIAGQQTNGQPLPVNPLDSAR
ncbi:MAG: recombinase family protein, partial [Actinomycetota bacterium]|nr:recombinase family protein [Actinomycetota bacterium]